MTTLSRAERKKLELRQEIIDASFACFAENGYHQTGIADIAARLGIGHGTFYRYFDNKRDIIEQVITESIEKIVGKLTEVAPPAAPSSLEEYQEQCERISALLIDIVLADLRLPKLLLFEATSVDPALTEQVFGLLDLAAQVNAAYFQHGVDQGYLRSDLDVEYAARAVNGMILAALIQGVRTEDPAEGERFSATIRDLMFRGLVS